MKARAKLFKDINFSITGKPRITIELPSRNCLSEIEGLEDITVEIKKYHERRTLDQNAMAWAFIDKLAEKLNVSKVEVYRTEIRNIGGVSDTVCVPARAVEKLITSWQKNGTGYSAETKPSKLDGCVNVTLYYGSSTFDTEQMSRLIDNILQDCQAVGIDTTPLAEAALRNQ